MNSQLHLALIPLLFASAITAQAYPRIEDVGALPVKLSNQSAVTLSVSLNPAMQADSWPEDHLILNVDFAGQQQDAALRFQSSYGTFQIELVDLDGDGLEEIILVKGDGRGTSVRCESLNIYRLKGEIIAPIASVPLSGYAGSGHPWNFSYRYDDTDANGTTDIILELDAMDHAANDTTLIKGALPTETLKIIKFSSDSEQLTVNCQN